MQATLPREPIATSAAGRAGPPTLRFFTARFEPIAVREPALV